MFLQEIICFTIFYQRLPAWLLQNKVPFLSLSLSYNLWDKTIPKFQFFCPILLFCLGLHVKGQVGSVYFGELWPRYRRIGAIRIHENGAKSETEELDDNQDFTIMHKKKKKKNDKMVGNLFPAGLHFLKRKSAGSFAVCHLKTKNSDGYLYI